MSSSWLRLLGRSFLFPRSSKGIPSKLGQLSSWCSCVRAMSKFPKSSESTIKMMTSADRQYFSHYSRKRGWPPKSHNFIFILPFLSWRWLNPIVGIVSSSNFPVEIVFTKELFPAYCSPTILISSSFVQNKDLIQSTNLDNILDFLFYLDNS